MAAPSHRMRADETPFDFDGAESVTSIYNAADERYLAYADGDANQPFSFDGLHAYADRYVWKVITRKLRQRRATGATSISILDAGCGPGTWLRRLVLKARALGFSDIEARGFDIADRQIERANMLAKDLRQLDGVKITFTVSNLTRALPEPTCSVDITLCLYSVLSHLPKADMGRVAAELARVTSGAFITTVRPVGSTPTAFISATENVRYLRYDHSRAICEVEWNDGYSSTFPFHLFSVAELQEYFSSHLEIEDIRGLDLFHGRFLPDTRWNPEGVRCDALQKDLERLESAYARRPEFMERAAHLLLIASREAPSTVAPSGCSAALKGDLVCQGLV
jgi:SAM-dependent methyltransferase